MTRAADRLVRRAAGAIALLAAGVAVGVARRRRREWLAGGGYREMAVQATVAMRRSREELYERCRDPHALLAALDRRASVEELDATTARVAFPQRDERPVVCHVRVTGEVPLLLIAWEVPDGPFPHTGTLRFEPLPDGDRVRVHAEARYRWSSNRARAVGLPDDLPARAVAGAMVRLQLARPKPTRT